MGIILLLGWLTATLGLFLAILSGTFVEHQFGISGSGRQLVQAVVMSIIIIPGTLLLYQQLYQQTGKPKFTSYSFKRSYHFFTGFFLAVTLAVIFLYFADGVGWINIEQWHTPEYWLGFMIMNMLIAFFYEALPEELVLRGLVYDVLKHRLLYGYLYLHNPLYLSYSSLV